MNDMSKLLEAQDELAAAVDLVRLLEMAHRMQRSKDEDMAAVATVCIIALEKMQSAYSLMGEARVANGGMPAPSGGKNDG